MDDIKSEFEAAKKYVEDHSGKLTDQQKLKLYGLFKQATVGENTTAKPSFLDMKGNAKWKAWNDQKVLTTDKAMKEYVSEVNLIQNS